MFVTADNLFYYHFVFGLFLTYVKLDSLAYNEKVFRGLHEKRKKASAD